MRICVENGPDLVQRIVETPDSDLRAHRVALAYHDVARHLSYYLNAGINVDPTAVDVATNGGSRNLKDPPVSANWFHFATWATRTLERNISPAKSPGRFTGPSGLRRVATPLVLSARSAGDQHAGRWLVFGQIRVMLSTVRPALHLLEQMAVMQKGFDDRDELPDQPPEFDFARWADEVWRKAGDDPNAAATRTTQESLSLAFQAYLTAHWHALRAVECERKVAKYRAKGKRRAKKLTKVESELNDSRQLSDRLRHRRAVRAEDADSDEGRQADIDEAVRCHQRTRDERRAAKLRRKIDTADRKRDTAQEKANQHRTRAAQHILLANVVITAVEQLRVDETVTEVLDFWPITMMDRAEHSLTQTVARRQNLPGPIAAIGVSNQLAATRSKAIDVWARVMTDQVLVLSLPGETLRLGRDLPPIAPGQPLIPRHLSRKAIGESIARPLVTAAPDHLLRHLLDLLETLDRSALHGRGSGANDWRRFDERMSWAVSLLRSRQFVWSLQWPPYNSEDVTRIEEGKLPLRGGDAFELEIPAPFGRPERRSTR